MTEPRWEPPFGLRAWYMLGIRVWHILENRDVVVSECVYLSVFPWLPSKTLCSLRVETMSVTSLHVFPPPEGGFTGKGSPAGCAGYFSASGDVVSRDPDMCSVPQEDAPFCMRENQSSD